MNNHHRRNLRHLRLRVWALLLTALTLGGGTSLGAQDSATTAPLDSKRPLATREQLQAALAEAEQIANGSGFSASFRQAKRDEAAMIRERLAEGDFFVGDQITIQVVGPDTSLGGLAGTHAVTYGRVLNLPTIGEIPLKGVLRAEAQDYLTQQVARYIRNPDIRVRPLVRLTFMGGVGAPGFHQVDADMLLSDALMLAGGINNSTVLKDSKILRGEDEIVDGETFVKAVNTGATIDQLNLRAGDEINVGMKTQKDWFTTVRTLAAIPALILSTYGLGRLFGIF
jgi:protein involved in polysaccharide export with SLBB domain